VCGCVAAVCVCDCVSGGGGRQRRLIQGLRPGRCSMFAVLMLLITCVLRAQRRHGSTKSAHLPALHASSCVASVTARRRCRRADAHAAHAEQVWPQLQVSGGGGGGVTGARVCNARAAVTLQACCAAHSQQGSGAQSARTHAPPLAASAGHRAYGAHRTCAKALSGVFKAAPPPPAHVCPPSSATSSGPLGVPASRSSSAGVSVNLHTDHVACMAVVSACCTGVAWSCKKWKVMHMCHNNVRLRLLMS
jgi:hypothetical protein